MTNRNLLDPGSLPSEPTIEQLREVVVDLWAQASIWVTRETDDYQVTGSFAHMVIIMANLTPKTVTFRDTPLDFQRVTVVQTIAQVTLDGNGKNINNADISGATLVLCDVGSAPTLIFSEDDDEWWPI